MSFLRTDRRRFIRNTAMVGAALALPELVPKAHASVAATKYFNLAQSSTEFFRNIDLQGNTAPMQSFAFNASDYCYILQSRGTDSAGTYTTYQKNGDLILNRLYPDHSNDGYMYLNGCGHGIAMGIDSNTSPVSIYVEAEADTDNLDSSGASHGRKLMRFHFSNGATITHSTTADPVDAEVFDPTIHILGTTGYQLSCSVDNTLHRIAIRYSTNPTGGPFYFQVYNLDSDWYAHTYVPLLSGNGVKMPAAPSGAGTPQGWCLYGSYIYLSYGTKENVCPGTVASASAGGSMIGLLNLNSASSIAGSTSQVGYTICEREPEGLTVRTSGGTPQLMIGLSGNEDGSTDHNASAYYKDQLLGP